MAILTLLAKIIIKLNTINTFTATFFPLAATGGFGEVWKADWDRYDFAVKIFHSRKFDNWDQEGEIYKTCMLVHPNIVRFWSMEINDNGEWVGMWLSAGLVACFIALCDFMCLVKWNDLHDLHTFVTILKFFAVCGGSTIL